MPGSLQVVPFTRLALVISAGFFSTVLAEPLVLDLSFRNLLKNDLQISPQEMALFFAIGGFPWYFKALIGLLSDTVPILGDRRRPYLIFSALLASAAWITVGLVPRFYSELLLGIVAVNVMLVFGSTVVGGLLVDIGHRYHVTARLVSIRVFVESFCTLIGGPLAGTLANFSIGVTAATGAAIALLPAPVTFFLLAERTSTEISSGASAKAQLRALLRSRSLWAAVCFLFFVSIPQEFQTPLFYHQSDVLSFPLEVIGYLRIASGTTSLLAAVVYGFVSQKLSLFHLLILGVSCAVAGALTYPFYYSLPMAIIVESFHGFLYTLATLVLMEVAVYATPKDSEATGFAILMGVWNAGDAIGDLIGATLVQQWHASFSGLALIYAASLVPAAVFTYPLLARSVLSRP